ncbi:MAG: hypothetical protein GAK30_03650 [Paracidovorax wautersii]|uniref:TPR repeat-containing protein n=1 Tax=Paracidovorax wautersii TaxID=1177982 RepID=A0A7V8FKW1_9BURK|nr:MAG: hypothetical protein GAK30_03650 [Paracidovorax wautersii]
MHHDSRPTAFPDSSAHRRPRLRSWSGLLAALAVATGLLAVATAPQAVRAQTTEAAQVSAAYQGIQSLIAQRRYAQAIEAADRYLEGNARDPQVRFLKGVAQTESGDTPAAIATFTELNQVYPELPEPYNNLAAIYAGQGDYDKARDALLQAIHANPAYATAYENLGDIYIELAAQQYRQAQSLDRRNARLAPKLRLIQQLLLPATPTPASTSAPTPTK